MIEVKAPGKIMLAGEWSILEPGHSCIVLPVNKFVTARIQESKKIVFNSDDIGLKNVVLHWDSAKNDVSLADSANISEEQKLRFKLCFTAIQNCLQFLSEQGVKIKPFELTVISEISNVTANSFIESEFSKSKFAKPGLGSSAAVTVAVCKAILKFHDFYIDLIDRLELVFKLACLSHYFASGKLGSGFDVACSAYKKPIVYSRFDQIWLNQKLADIKKISEIVLLKWPALEIKEIKLPENMQVLIGFVGYSASTTKMIEKMNLFKNSQTEIYQSIMQSINFVVLKLVRALECCDQIEIISLITKNRDLLANLSAESGIELETKELELLIYLAQDCAAKSLHKTAAKFSGAGGGDCGIAVCFDDIIAQKIFNEWNSAGIKCI